VIWAADRNREQGRLVADIYRRSAGVPCNSQCVIAGGLRGADKSGALVQSGIDPAAYMTINIDAVIEEMALRDLIPSIQGLSPLDAADLVHAEAQFLAKRLGLRAIVDGRNLIFEISMASWSAVQSWLATLRSADYTVHGIFVDISIEESIRRCKAEYRTKHDDFSRGVGLGGRYVPSEAVRALAASRLFQDRDDISSIAGNCSSSPPENDKQFLGGEIVELINNYQAGRITLKAVAAEFRARTWPERPSVCPPSLTCAAAAIDDPEPYVPGSFDDVVVSYDCGRLSDHDYEQLALAAIQRPSSA
jgi:hypothetical protein